MSQISNSNKMNTEESALPIINSKSMIPASGRTNNENEYFEPLKLKNFGSKVIVFKKK